MVNQTRSLVRNIRNSPFRACMPRKILETAVSGRKPTTMARTANVDEVNDSKHLNVATQTAYLHLHSPSFYSKYPSKPRLLHPSRTSPPESGRESSLERLRRAHPSWDRHQAVQCVIRPGSGDDQHGTVVRYMSRWGLMGR